MRHPLHKGVVAFAAGMLLAGVSPLFVASAAAQGLIFDWGGEKTADSGKQHIKFNGPGKLGDIIVSFGDRKLYFFTGPGEADTYPVAIPRDQSRWEGVTTVSMKRENPSWTPTAHMLSENPKLPRWVPGGHPMNPLGNRAMYLGSSDYRIHGTDAPWTIGTAASKGCVRMFNKDVADLYPRVKVGSKVTVTWQKFDGRTLAVANNANPVSDPDQSPQNKALLASLPQKGDATAQSGKPANVKSRKPVDAAEDDNHASSSEKAEKSKVAAIAEEPVVRRKRSKSADSAESSGDTADQSRQPAAGPAEQQVLKQKFAKAAESTETPDEGGERVKTKVAPATPEAVPRAARRVRSATRQVSSPKSEARTDATPAPASTSSEQASLAVAERALAAAERAAEAAERAAAAAERAVAASEKRGQTISAEPGQPSVVTH